MGSMAIRTDIVGRAAAASGLNRRTTTLVIQAFVDQVSAWLNQQPPPEPASAKPKRPILDYGDGELLRLNEAGEILGCSGATVRKWIDDGILRVRYLGTTAWVPRPAIDELIGGASFVDKDAC